MWLINCALPLSCTSPAPLPATHLPFSCPSPPYFFPSPSPPHPLSSPFLPLQCLSPFHPKITPSPTLRNSSLNQPHGCHDDIMMLTNHSILKQNQCSMNCNGLHFMLQIIASTLNAISIPRRCPRRCALEAG